MILYYMESLHPEKLERYYILEVVLLIFNLCLFIGLIILTCRVKLHVNLKIFGVFMEIQYFPVILGRLIIIGYECGLLQKQGRPEENWIIVWSSLVRCHYSALAATVIFWFSIERQLATYFIIDYENKPRYWIPLLLMGLATVGAGCASYIYAYELIMWQPLVLLGLVQNMVGFMLFFHTYKRTKGIVNELKIRRKNSMHIYTLSLRFQLQENLWCAQVLRNAFITLITANIFTAVFALLVTVPFFKILFDDETLEKMNCLFNILIAVNGPVIIAGAILYNDHLVKTLKGIFCPSKVDPNKSATDEGQVYFVHLRQQWDVQGKEEGRPAPLPPVGGKSNSNSKDRSRLYFVNTPS